MRRLIFAMLFVSAFVLFGNLRLSAEEDDQPRFSEDKVIFHGYLTNYTDTNVYESDSRTDTGNITYLRLKGSFKPQDNLAFRVEAFCSNNAGNQNPYIILQDYGLLSPDMNSETQQLTIDHAWGDAGFKNMDLQFGKIPIGWGTGYIFNPTQRTAASDFINPVIEETPGTLAFQTTWSFNESVSLSGYLAFQDKSHRDTAEVQDGSWNNLPFGVKTQFVVGKFDFSASVIKEVFFLQMPSNEYFCQRSWFLGADMSGAIWDFGIYSEAVLRLPTNQAETAWNASGFDFLRALEMAAGFDFTFSALDDIELRVEYYHQGPRDGSFPLWHHEIIEQRTNRFRT